MNLSLIEGGLGADRWVAVAINGSWAITYINSRRSCGQPRFSREQQIRWAPWLRFGPDGRVEHQESALFRSWAYSDEARTLRRVMGFPETERATERSDVYLRLIRFEGRVDVVACTEAGCPYLDGTLLSLHDGRLCRWMGIGPELGFLLNDRQCLQYDYD